MYKYKYVESDGQRLFCEMDHREIIDKYASKGWRFVTAIPTDMSGHGIIKKYDLVFEKEDINE